MRRIPIEEFKFPRYEDQDVINAWHWFMSFISERNWQTRKQKIESNITFYFRPTTPFSEPLTEGTLLVEKRDVIGWYLYLIDTLINEPHKYEYFQGARVVPIFKRLGEDLEKVKGIEGIEKKVKELLNKRQSEADAFLFEILTALLWTRNGYEVAFIGESAKKTPDLVAKKEGKTWNIECKRQSKTSDYTYQETAKRQKMVSHIGQNLLRKNILLNIVFHVELHTLDDDFLKILLDKKLDLSIPGKIISNKQVDIDLEFIDIAGIKKHLQNHWVKNNSPMLNFLIGRRPVDNKSFTCAMYANFVRVGEGDVNNLFVDDIENAYAVYWDCDAPESLKAKARDIKKQVFAATQQFNSEITGVLHIGMETFDGPEVEKVRLEKIDDTIKSINPHHSKLRWIFCSFFQAYSPPDQIWAFDETVSTMSAYIHPKPPLSTRLMVAPENTETEDNLFHWERPLP